SLGGEIHMQENVLPEIHRLIEQIRALTNSPLPEMLEPDSPVLDEQLLGASSNGFYLVGIIGGKNVGKSALVNAIVGEEITARSSTGRGTERVVAYAHISQKDALATFLSCEAPGRHEIVTHDRDDVTRQVLLDLPDFDSHYSEHF